MKNKIIRISVIIVFLFRLWSGFQAPTAAPGDIPGGAMNEPIAVVFSALIVGAVAWILFELVFLVIAKIKNCRTGGEK